MSSLADLPEIVGFFSYSREDDEAFARKLSALRDAIHRELGAQLGRSKTNFRLWQDQAAIALGKLWESEIKTAVDQSVFFIPIVTPRAVNSKYCKFEFEMFLAREKAIGRSDLIFPIIYITVPALESEAKWRDDPVLSIIGRRQYVDWRPLRHLDVHQTAVSEQIERLCRKIVEALNESWVSPEERRRVEEAETRQQAADEARRVEAEVKRKADEEERRRQVEAAARQRAEQEEFRRNTEAQAMRRAEDERRRKEEAESKRYADQEEHQRQAAEARRRAEDDRRRQEPNAKPLEFVQGASAVAERTDITGVMHQEPEPGNTWQPSRRALAIAGVLAVIFLGSVGVWLATRPEIAPKETMARPLPAPVPATPVQPAPAQITPTPPQIQLEETVARPLPAPVPATPDQPAPAPIMPTPPLIQPASGAIGPLPLERERALKPKDAFKECETCPELVVVPEGSFMMGSRDEPERDVNEVRHQVTIPRPFAVGRFAVTFDEWEACIDDGGCNRYRPADRGWGRGTRPVIFVSWSDAKSFVAWLSNKTRKNYRLLTEAEREYIARAGTATPFWWGSSISTEEANYNGNYVYGTGQKGEYRQATVPVQAFAPNAWGFYQVHGNVWEWAEDCWNDTYDGAPEDSSAWTKGDCKQHVHRGGSWNSPPGLLRSASRGKESSHVRHYMLGFRIARSLER